jgi:hypothetical protein
MHSVRKIVITGMAAATLAGGVSAVVAAAAAAPATAAGQPALPNQTGAQSRAWNGVLAGWAWNGPVVTNPTAVEY